MGGYSSTMQVTHNLHIHTGDKKGADVKDAVVYMTFTDVVGKVSDEILLTDCGHDDFKRGKEVNVPLELPALLKICDIKIRRDNEDNTDDWYALRVVVDHLNSQGDVLENSVFPINRWLHGGEEMSFSEFDSTLPQFDKHAVQRKEELMNMRRQYVLSGKILGAPPQVEIVPKDEQFTNRYFLSIGADFAVVAVQSLYTNLTTDKVFDSLEDVETLYGGPLPTPSGLNNWKSDVEFGNQKLAGCSPALIEICREIPAHMKEIIDNRSILEKNLLEGLSIAQAISQRRLYKIDLRYLADIECTRGKTLPGPTCLLFTKDSGDLVPVAIQIMPTPAADNPVFTPNDSEYTWLAAKIWFNYADCSHHQASSHLGMTHLLVESVAVITNRQLSQSHPIYKLMAPHFYYVMSINDLAVKQLVSPGGWVDNVMEIGRVGMFNIISKRWAEWDLQKEGNLPKSFARRDIKDIPNYFYKEDSLLLWNAIEKYVADVVNQVYDTREKLSGDAEIHAWADELRSAAKFNGIEDITKNAVLIEMVTVFIFTASVQHAAVNFGQYDEYAFPPNFPAIMNETRPTTHDHLTEAYVVSSLPSKEQTMDMIKITQILSQRGTKALGDFEIQYGYDPIATKALYSFQAELRDIEAKIDTSNKTRKRKYDILQPSSIPNAISI